MSKRLNELMQHGHNSCITMECVCKLFFSCVVPPPPPPHTQSAEVLLYNPVPQSLLACVEVFLVTCTYSAPCFQRDVSGRHHVKDSVRWSLTFRPELYRRDAFVPSAGGGSRADLIVCTSKCTLQHQCTAPFHIMRKAIYFL